MAKAKPLTAMFELVILDSQYEVTSVIEESKREFSDLNGPMYWMFREE